jgi:hypothetical protein
MNVFLEIAGGEFIVLQSICMNARVVCDGGREKEAVSDWR